MARKNKHTTTEKPHYRIITVEEPLSLAAESYRRIKTSLEFANVDKHPQVIQVCSSMQEMWSKYENETPTPLRGML